MTDLERPLYSYQKLGSLENSERQEERLRKRHPVTLLREGPYRGDGRLRGTKPVGTIPLFGRTPGTDQGGPIRPGGDVIRRSGPSSLGLSVWTGGVIESIEIVRRGDDLRNDSRLHSHDLNLLPVSYIEPSLPTGVRWYILRTPGTRWT